MSTFEERARAAGYSDKDTANTRALVEKIQRILKEEDLDPFDAPELAQPKEVRLARLFIDDYQALTLQGDEGIARWLEEKRGLPVVADAVRRRVHWKWIQTEMTPKAVSGRNE